MDTILYFYEMNKRSAAALEKEARTSGKKIEAFAGGYAIICPNDLCKLVKIALEQEALGLLEELPGCKWWDFKGKRKIAKHRQAKEKLLNEILLYWGEGECTYCVCAPPITYFDKWPFEGYRDKKWVAYLLQKAAHPHYVLLGYTPCLAELLPGEARRMKSLSVFVTERELSGELEGFLEDFFEEYGVAADIHLLEDKSAYRKLSMISQVPCNILDFSKEERISPWIAPAGSVWLDFDGTEEKWGRVEGRNSKIQYFSLVKEWKNA